MPKAQHQPIICKLSAVMSSLGIIHHSLYLIFFLVQSCILELNFIRYEYLSNSVFLQFFFWCQRKTFSLKLHLSPTMAMYHLMFFIDASRSTSSKDPVPSRCEYAVPRTGKASRHCACDMSLHFATTIHSCVGTCWKSERCSFLNASLFPALGSCFCNAIFCFDRPQFLHFARKLFLS